MSLLFSAQTIQQGQKSAEEQKELQSDSEIEAIQPGMKNTRIAAHKNKLMLKATTLK